MAYEQKENSGSLWDNDKKEKDTHSDLSGTLRVGDIEFYIDGWKKQAKDGREYISLSVKPK